MYKVSADGMQEQYKAKQVMPRRANRDERKLLLRKKLTYRGAILK